MLARRESDLYLTLMVIGRWSIMPEILEFLGGDSQELLRFIDLFGGMRLDIPTREKVATMARNIHVYRTVKQDDRESTKQWLADLYGITVRRIRSIYDETQAELEDLDERTGTTA